MGLDMYLYSGKDDDREEIGYWRKANQVHKWFTRNNPSSNVEDIPVTREELIELRSICKAVLEEPDTAENDLPTQGGFFFGNTDYDEWYYNNLEETVDIIDKALKRNDEVFYYWCWW